MMKRLTFLSWVLAAFMLTGVSYAQNYPNKPVRLIVPYAAGGNFDIIARMLAQGLTERWGRPMYVENRTGANGNIGTEQLVRSAPDGYTLGLVSNGTTAINPALYKSMPFDPLTDLTPITIVTSNPMVLIVNASFPVKSVPELVQYAKANPGKVNFASGGNGTLSHLSLEMLKSRSGINIVHVPYKGTSNALNDVLAGQVQGMFDTISTSIPYIDSGKVRALAVTSPGRFATRPEMPTLSEMGVRDFSAEPKSGLVGPAGMPRDLVERIQKDVAAVLQKPEVRQKLRGMGLEPRGMTPDEFAADMKSELVKWGEIVKASGAKTD